MSRFLGPRMVAVAFLAHFAGSGFTFYSYSVLMPALLADFGGGGLVGSLGMVAFQLALSVSGPFIGPLLDRRSIRAVMGIGAGVTALGFFAASFVPSLWVLLVLYGTLIGIGATMMGHISANTLVAKWYERRRGRALGIAQLGISASGVVMTVVCALLIEQVGWRGTYAVYGALTLIAIGPVVALTVVSRPEEVGQRPDGEPPLAHPEPPRFVRTGVRDVVGEPQFWVIAATVSMAMAVNSVAGVHLPRHVEQLGFSLRAGGVAVSALAAMAMLGKPLFGWLVDRFDKRWSPCLIAALHTVGLLWLSVATSLPAIIAASGIFGLGLGGQAPVWGALVGSAFGRERFGRVTGFMGPVMLPISLLGMFGSGWAADVLGGYSLVFRATVVFAVLSLFTAYFYRPVAELEGDA